MPRRDQITCFVTHTQICTLLQTNNHASTTTQFFTGRMPFLLPNQQRQSTEGHRQHAQKFGEDRTCISLDMTVNRQTHTQTDPLITILRSPIESGVKTNMAMIPLNDSTTVIKRSVTGTKFQKKVPLFWRYWTFLIHSIRCAKGSLPMIIISLISSAISTDQPTHRQIQGHTTLLLPTLLPESQVSISLVIHRL